MASPTIIRFNARDTIKMPVGLRRARKTSVPIVIGDVTIANAQNKAKTQRGRASGPIRIATSRSGNRAFSASAQVICVFVL